MKYESGNMYVAVKEAYNILNKKKKELEAVGNIKSKKYEDLVARLGLIKELVGYLKGLDYLVHKQTKARIKTYLATGMNYQETAKQLGVSVDAVKVSVSYASGIIKKRIGENTVKHLVNGQSSVTALRMQYELLSGKVKVKDYLVSGVYLPTPKFSSISLAECERELTYLQWYSKATRDKFKDKTDPERLKHLLYVLQCDNDKLAEDRVEILGILQGEVNAKNYIKKLKSRDGI